MKLFVCFALIAAAAFAAASPTSGVGANVGSAVAGSVNQEVAESEVQQGVQPVAVQSAIDLTRLRKSAGYGGGYGASIPAPPCPKNYLFSCQPNLSPIACSAPSYGSAGAYSAPVPTYVAPIRGNIGIPQGIGYNPNQFYQY